MNEVEEPLDSTQWRSVPGAAKYLDISVATMYRWISDGRVTKHKFDGLTVVSVDDLRDLKKRDQLKREIRMNGENYGDEEQDSHQD